MHCSPERKQEILDKYENKYAVSKMSITTPNVLKRFPNLRPFNKILVGAGCKTDDKGGVIIPTMPYLDGKQRQCIQYIPFTNYSTGEKFSDSVDTVPYWKPLSGTLDDYANHKETKSGILEKFGDRMKEGIGIDKEEVELEVEEHAVQRQSGTLTLDHHGHEVKEFPHKIDSRSVENYPTRILEQNSENIKHQEMTRESCIEKLRMNLCKISPQDIRMNSEKFIVDKITPVYVPIHEARCVDPKKRVEILRIDGIAKKMRS